MWPWYLEIFCFSSSTSTLCITLTTEDLDLDVPFLCTLPSIKCTLSLFMSFPHLLPLDPDEEVMCHMLLSLGRNFRERRREWRGDVICWQESSSLLCCPGGETMFHSPPLAKTARDTKRGKVRGVKLGKEQGGGKGGTELWHTLLPSSLLLADKLSDTTDYSSHYSQCLTSVCICVRMASYLCLNVWTCIHTCPHVTFYECVWTCFWPWETRMLLHQRTSDTTYVGSNVFVAAVFVYGVYLVSTSYVHVMFAGISSGSSKLQIYQFVVCVCGACQAKCPEALGHTKVRKYCSWLWWI